MKKILLAVADSQLPSAAFEFVRRLNELNPVLLTGIFLREVVYELPGISYYGGLGLPAYTPPIETFAEEEITKRIEWFSSLCQKHDIEYRVHNDTDDLLIHQLEKETRFADLLVISAEGFYELFGLAEPEGNLKTILHLAECPVLIVPENFEFPHNIVFAYDGSGSSVYAIKQFSYVLPELADKEMTLVYEDKNVDAEIPDKALIQEFAARHFSGLSFLKLDKNVTGFSSWIHETNATLLVCGSYGRSAASQLFRKSFVSDVLREHKLPVFVAHK